MTKGMESIATQDLKSPVKRLVSKRDIGIEAFELENGNLMMEATFLDPYHLIRFNMQIDPSTRKIVAAKSEMANHPHEVCPSVNERTKTLIGVEVARGVTREINKRIGGPDGCIHLREVMLETINFAATVLVGYDGGFGLMSREFNLLEEKKRFDLSKHVLKNSCHVYKETLE